MQSGTEDLSPAFFHLVKQIDCGRAALAQLTAKCEAKQIIASWLVLIFINQIMCPQRLGVRIHGGY